MWATGYQSSGLFLVEILGAASADIGNGTPNIGPPDHYREVADIGSILLLEVMVEPILGNPPGGKCRPGPVRLPLHHTKHLLLKPFPIHRLPRKGGISMMITAMKMPKPKTLIFI